MAKPRHPTRRHKAACPSDGRLGEGECPTPDTPHRGTRHPPRATSSRFCGAQHKPTRACAVGLVTGPNARTSPA